MKKTLAALATLTAVTGPERLLHHPRGRGAGRLRRTVAVLGRALHGLALLEPVGYDADLRAGHRRHRSPPGTRPSTATINDSQVSRDFLATLPTTLPWERNAGIEYITELAAPMTETGPFYTDVEAGDIVYYNPMDSITIIYAPTSSVPTLTKMGEVTSDLAAFENLPDNVDMRIERQ